MFNEFRKFETTLAGRPLVVETGKMAGLAGGSCLIKYGETEVLCTATMATKPRPYTLSTTDPVIMEFARAGIKPGALFYFPGKMIRGRTAERKRSW